ncbi:MAG: glutathione peroxidase, partial [Draconibacterium sp.]|nr:glutathione peroxidase [Draconibacterium sp.]
MNLYDLDIKANGITGEKVSLSDFQGKILVIVNTASKCGFTPQFKGLESLYQKYKNLGVEVLGFPCNQFKEQDPGTNNEIKEFCKINYGVTFKMFQKIDVNGENRHQLYKFLIENSPVNTGEDIKWNFEKFIVGRNGEVLNRFSSIKTP